MTAVQINEAASEIYSGGIDNEIKVWDMRKKAVVYTLPGHTDTVTSLEISHDNQKLLSKSMDSTVRTWDIRSFAPTNRHIQTYDGAPAGVEKNLIRASWNETDDKIATGSGDRVVVVWEAGSGKLLYRLPGHRGTVNDVRFSPGDNPLCKFALFLSIAPGSLVGGLVLKCRRVRGSLSMPARLSAGQGQALILMH